MQKESFYFSHDANAHIDDKILELRSEYGWEGYGIFWVLIEILRSQSDYSYERSKMAGLSIATAKPKDWLILYIDYCIELGLFVEKDGDFYSESLMNRMEQIDEKRKKRADAGRLGGLAKAALKQKSSNAIAKGGKEKKVKESKTKETKGNELLVRELTFKESLYPFVEEYGKDTVKAFFEYWSEPNKSNSKMLFETKTTWDLNRRISRWANSNFNSSNSDVKPSIHVNSDKDNTVEERRLKDAAKVKEMEDAGMFN
jgi:hypothetical protein